MIYSDFLDEAIQKAAKVRPLVFDQNKREIAKKIWGISAIAVGGMVMELMEPKFFNPLRIFKYIAAAGLAVPLVLLLKQYDMLNKSGANFVLVLNNIREKYRERFDRTEERDIPFLMDEVVDDLIQSV